MKQRLATRSVTSVTSVTEVDTSLQRLSEALACLGDPRLVAAFLQDLCTPAELEAMADRWRVVPLLVKGVPYREIHALTQVSITTIGRVARTLEHGAGGYAAALRGPSAYAIQSH